LSISAVSDYIRATARPALSSRPGPRVPDRRTGRFCLTAVGVSLRVCAGLLVGALLAGAAAGCSPNSAGSAAKGSVKGAFRIGVIPYENPQEETEEYQQFGAFLGQKINGQPAVVTVAQDYVGVVTALENDQEDAAYLNPLSYVIASDRARKAGRALVPISMPYVIMKGQTKGDLTYEGVIFARKDSGIKNLSDLKGKTIAFNEQTSTSGYLYPVSMLIKAGINPRAKSDGGDLKQVYFAGAQGVVPAVMHGQADAGAIFAEGIRLSLPNEADQAQVRIIARTPPIPNGMFVARGDLDPAIISKLKSAMADLNTDPAGKAAEAKMRVEKWVPADDALFDPVRQTARVLGLNLETIKKH
jgi:phosphonate transport system substrate-binding protein